MNFKYRKKRLNEIVKGGTTRLVNPELARQAEAARISEDGILRQKTQALRLPDSLIEASDTSPTRLLPGRFMTTIVILALIFISIITWFVSRMPE